MSQGETGRGALLADALEALESVKREEQGKTGHRVITLADVLERYGGARRAFTWSFVPGERAMRYEVNGATREAEVFDDALSGERSAFVALPLEYIHHDPVINPRPVNLNLENLIREFARGNPQLQQCLARVDGDRVRIFDGQHKTVARILLGEREILMRLFLNADPAKLMETNARAGKQLKQIEFDAQMERKVNNALFQMRLRQYRECHGYADDDQSFLTDEIINELMGRETED